MKEPTKQFTVIYNNKAYLLTSNNNFYQFKEYCRKFFSIPHNTQFELYDGIQLITINNFNNHNRFTIRMIRTNTMNLNLNSSVMSYPNQVHTQVPIKLSQSMMIHPNNSQTSIPQQNFSFLPIQNEDESQKNLVYIYIQSQMDNYVNSIISDYKKYEGRISLQEYLNNMYILFASNSNMNTITSRCNQCQKPIYNIKYICNHCQTYIICDKCFHSNLGTNIHPYSFTVSTISLEPQQPERNLMSQSVLFNPYSNQNMMSSMNNKLLSQSVIGDNFVKSEIRTNANKIEIPKPKKEPIKEETNKVEQKKIDDFINIINKNFKVRNKYYINDIISAVIEGQYDEEKTMNILLNKEYCILKR